MGMQSLKCVGERADVALVIPVLVLHEVRWIGGDAIAVDGGSKL
jgi:hypothetical protein